MWQLGLGGGAESYPERPDEPDCIYYLRTGFCGYGNRCRFNHPRDRSMAMGALRADGGEYPERVGQSVCQGEVRLSNEGPISGLRSQIMSTESTMCSRRSLSSSAAPRDAVPFLIIIYWALFPPGYSRMKIVVCMLDFAGGSSPSSSKKSISCLMESLLQGEKECSYYVKTGQCKFGVTCKYHHPQPAGIQAPPPAPAPAVYPSGPSPSVQSSQQYGVLQGNWPVARPAMIPGSYVPGSYGPMLLPPGVVPAPVSPVASPGTQPAVGASLYGITQLSPSATAYTGPYLSITSSAGPSSSSLKEHAFPERPGQPECQYYLRTGDCKFGATCKYHHPPEWSAAKINFALSPMGLPLRPGAPLCSHYAQNGVCRFGPSCKFDHPMRTLSYSPSASSLTDMPVAPYPVGSTNATLAPSSSSSDLRPELLSGLSKDAFSSQMSSMNSSSASVGSIFSTSGPVPQSSVHQSGQGSISSSGGSSISHGGEVHTSS
ncbi:hypothetical protein DH2020_035803 [Rehmannia glutinosa]|uniref:C3H1-type domain-containing protein n=1 Tax=Rehmannia glutinosa TaxID=99300 RepID=A0ABR0V912_REHGL